MPELNLLDTLPESQRQEYLAVHPELAPASATSAASGSKTEESPPSVAEGSPSAPAAGSESSKEVPPEVKGAEGEGKGKEKEEEVAEAKETAPVEEKPASKVETPEDVQERLKHTQSVQDGRIRASDARKKLRMAELRTEELEKQLEAAKLQVAPAPQTKPTLVDVEGLELTDEEKRFIIGEEDNELSQQSAQALRSVIAKIAAKTITPKIKGLEEELAKHRTDQEKFVKEREHERLADYQFGLEDETGLTRSEIADLVKSSAFIGFLGEYDPAIGAARQAAVERGNKEFNPDPLIVAIKNFQGAKPNSPEKRAVAQAASSAISSKPSPPITPKPLPAKPTYTVAEYTALMNELSRENVYSPGIAEKIETLRTAQREGRVK